MTGELPPTPENVLPAASMVLTPGVRGAAGAAQAVAGTAQAAQAAMPRFMEGGPRTQLTAEVLARTPGVGGPIRKAAREAIETLKPHLDSLDSDRTKLATLERIAKGGTSHIGKAVLAGWGIADPASALSSVIGARSMAKYLASPSTAAPIAQWSKAYTRMIQSGGAIPRPWPAYKIATSNLENSLGEKIDPEKLTAALKGR